MTAPTIGFVLTVELPGERMRAPIVAIHDDDHVVVELESAPMSRSHQYKIGSRVLVRREAALMGTSWEAMDESLLAIQAAHEREMKKAPPVKKEKRRAVVRK